MGRAVEKTLNREILTIREVAQYLRLSEAKIYELARTGSIPAMRIGKSWRFKKDLIDDWFRQQSGNIPNP